MNKKSAASRAALYGTVPSDAGTIIPAERAGNHRKPCPHCDRGPRDDALSIRVDPDGRVIWKCWRCQWTGSQRGTSRLPAPSTGRVDREQDKARERLRRLWRESEPLDLARHDVVARYFENLGLRLADHPHDLRHHPRLPYWQPGGDRPIHIGDYHGILAVARGPDGRVANLHRTYLSHDGRKADVANPRKLCPPHRKIRGAAIRLYPAGEQLAVAEGLETALAVHIATGLPVWSCISAHGLTTVEIPEGVLELVIAADHDEAGIDAAKAAARRLSKQCAVRVVVPDEPGTDWADHLGGAA